jgi:hypothetical protein
MPPSPSRTVGAFVRGFKGYVTSRVNALRGNSKGVVWQRNYHERIIRTEVALKKITSYIENNVEIHVRRANKR